MKKRIIITLATATLILGLAGCGEAQIMNLTDEETRMIGEYAAITMMRYDAGHRSRLVNYTAMLTAPEPKPTAEPGSTEEPSGMDPVDDTPVIGAGGQAGTSFSIEETLDLPEGVSVAFLNHALHDSYPEGEHYFGMTATEGKKFLVLSFSISNASAQDQSIDLLHSEAEFRITVNGEYTRRALPTILENDFSSYEGTVPAGGSAEAVLVIEIDNEMAGNIASITVNVKNDQKNCTIQAF